MLGSTRRLPVLVQTIATGADMHSSTFLAMLAGLAVAVILSRLPKAKRGSGDGSGADGAWFSSGDSSDGCGDSGGDGGSCGSD